MKQFWKQVLKEREGIAIETTGLPLRDACSFSLLFHIHTFVVFYPPLLHQVQQSWRCPSTVLLPRLQPVMPVPIFNMLHQLLLRWRTIFEMFLLVSMDHVHFLLAVVLWCSQQWHRCCFCRRRNPNLNFSFLSWYVVHVMQYVLFYPIFCCLLFLRFQLQATQFTTNISYNMSKRTKRLSMVGMMEDLLTAVSVEKKLLQPHLQNIYKVRKWLVWVF